MNRWEYERLQETLRSHLDNIPSNVNKRPMSGYKDGWKDALLWMVSILHLFYKE